MHARSMLLALALTLGLSAPAGAHPHVWVTTTAEVVYDGEGRVAAVRHAWTFDPAYSSFITQGLDRNNDGSLTPDELQELAKVNTESLVDFDYFTQMKLGGAKQTFAPPRNPAMSMAGGQAVLTFELPLKTPARAGKVLALEVYDPTFFVSFTMAEGDPVRLAGAPTGCATTITRPKSVEAAGQSQQKLSEAFFEALNAASAYGSQFANRALVACP